MNTSYIMPVKLTEVNRTDWKFTGIYKITNVITGKCYIGQAIDIRSRLMEHANNNHTKKLAIYNSIEKHGVENFEAKVLVIINTFGKNQKEIKQELNYHECFYIQMYDSYKNGYNMTPGGDSGRLGFKHSKETIEKIKAARKGSVPKVAKDSCKNTYAYDLLTDCIIDAESVIEMSHKTGVDPRSIGHICRNHEYKEGGRFISENRWLFSYDKNDLKDRVDFYISGEYDKRKHYKYKHHWVLWRERNGRLQQED